MQYKNPHIEELLREGRAADKVDRERAKIFEALLASKGWRTYVEVLTAMIEQKGADLLQPAGGVDGAIGLEYVKGTMYGLLLARDLPSSTVAQMNASRPATENEDADSE